VQTLLSVNNYYYRRGGAEVVFLEENQLLEDIGWQVVPFAMRHPKNEDTPWSEYFVDEIEFGHDYSLAGKIARVPKVIYSREAQRKINRLIDKAAPDIAHLHNIYHHISPSILKVLKQRDIPVVLTAHDLKVACPAYAMLAPDGVCERCKGGRFYQVAVNRCIKQSLMLSTVVMLESYLHHWLRSYRDNVDVIVTPSKFYKDKLTEWGWDPGGITHVPNYVDIDKYTPVPAAGDYFVFFGRLSREKGLDTLIRSAAKAGARLRIVGTGPDAETLAQLVDTLQADVEFTGYRSGADLHAEVANARAVVLPSEWYENGPISVLEAYALSTPVIGADIGGIPEFIRRGETGDVFETGSVAELADMLGRFQAAPDQAIIDMGRAGRQWVEEDFTPARYRERILSVFAAAGGIAQ
jgi:glycosyltransferase involved in cell wall biosynthesis